MNTRFTLKSFVSMMGLMAVALTACAAPIRPISDAVENRAYDQAMPAATAAPVMEAPRSAPAAGGATASSVEPQQQAQPRLIIRTAHMTIVVSNTQEQLDAISKLATQYRWLRRAVRHVKGRQRVAGADHLARGCEELRNSAGRHSQDGARCAQRKHSR